MPCLILRQRRKRSASSLNERFTNPPIGQALACDALQGFVGARRKGHLAARNNFGLFFFWKRRNVSGGRDGNVSALHGLLQFDGALFADIASALNTFWADT